MKLSREEKQEMINHCKYNLEIPTLRIFHPKAYKMFERMLVMVMEVEVYD